MTGEEWILVVTGLLLLIAWAVWIEASMPRPLARHMPATSQNEPRA